MVYAFLIHSLEEEKETSNAAADVTMMPVGQSAANVQVCFSHFFTAEGNDVHRKKREQQLAASVWRDFAFRQRCAEGFARVSKEENKRRSSSPAPSLELPFQLATTKPAFEGGEFRISGSLGGGPSCFSSPKIGVWKQFRNTAMLLVCEPDENRYLAANFLSLFASVLAEHFKSPAITAKPKELLSRPEEIMLLLEVYLPNGLLLFTSSHLSKHWRRQAEPLLAK
ncbi:hypothetical protein QOT17_024593 [Balamuthia mandrillaris]